ncbi:MAG: DNA recombination protein RmuC [Gammaproteobacteria bacterium]|nr:MAG: DNA recombination protein RmuC [Gammaproteobacteria bacterium]
MDTLVASLALFLAGAATGAVLLGLRMQARLARLRAERARLEAELAAERSRLEERTAAFEQARRQLAETFDSLAAQALDRNAEAFLKLARENLARFQAQAALRLEEKEKTIEHLVRPIRETLEKTEQQLRRMENERREAFGSLTEQLRAMGEAQNRLQLETRHLVQALRRPEVRGQWGELTLKRVVELAGMVEHCDFEEQVHQATERGAVRPDMIVHLPDRRRIVVDAKTPLDAYLEAVEASDEAQRQQALARHARNLREHVRQLASKAYWEQFEDTPDFVVLFVPGDQFLSHALTADPDLLEYALGNRVILATPSSLIALLRAVAYGWRQEALAENAEEIRKLGEELHGRLATFTEHLVRVGKSLDASVNAYNKAVGSLDARVLPAARRFGELGIHAKKPIAEPEPVDRLARPLATPADDDVAD